MRGCGVKMSFVMQLAMNRLVPKRVVFGCVVRCTGFHSNVKNKEFTTNGVKTYVPVADFYKGKSVMITGGTGFLGMVLLEKLLYTCTGIEKVFLLVREKKGVSPEQRLQQFLNDPLFKRLKDDKPTFLKKLIPIHGDISAANLGISEEDANTLTEEVSVVFHSAATVRFDEKMSVPFNVNFKGTTKMLELSKKMKNLEMFVHISTAYANVRHLNSTVREVLYPPPATLDEVYDFIAKYNDDKEMTTQFLNGSVNTYTFAKSLAEDYVAKNKEHVPVTIVRPAAVTATAEGPVPGWTSGWQGVPKTLYNVSMGYSRVHPGRSVNVIDFIPVDYVVNLCIIAATKSRGTNDLPVFNCCSSSVNPITWNDAYKWFTEDVVRRGKNDLSFPFSMFAESKYAVWVLTVLTQLLPAYIYDMWLRITGKDARYVQIQKRVISVRNSMDFFMRYSSLMENHNVMKIFGSLSKDDQKIFPCDPTDINWRDYMHVYAQGVDKYLVKK